MRGFPTESMLEFFLAGNENSGITGAAGTEFTRDFAASDALRCIDDLQNREPAAVAYVEGFARDAVDFLESAEVGIGDVEDVNVIADAGSVRCGIVGAEDIDMGNSAAGGIENAGNDVSLHTMMLAAFLGGSGSVEIAEGHVVEPGIGLVIPENLFENEFGFSVRVDGRFPMVFGNGNDFRFAVRGSGGREDEFFYAVAGDGIEQIHTAGHIGGVENTWFADGFGHESLGGEVHHGVDFVLSEDGFKRGAVCEIDLAKDGAGRHGGTMSFQQAIQGDDGHAMLDQYFRADTADVTCRAGNENIHL